MSKYAVTTCDWDHNGAHRVTVTGPLFRTTKAERRARDTAKRSVPMPHLVQWSRLDDVTLGDDLRLNYHFTVSRLDRTNR